MTKDAWLNHAVESVVEKMKFQTECLGKTTEQAIEIVKLQTSAGSGAWKIALQLIAKQGD